jgi:hypothetical protein
LGVPPISVFCIINGLCLINNIPFWVIDKHPADTTAVQIRQLFDIRKTSCALCPRRTPATTECRANSTPGQRHKALADNSGWLTDMAKKISGKPEDVIDSVRIRLGLTKEE